MRKRRTPREIERKKVHDANREAAMREVGEEGHSSVARQYLGDTQAFLHDSSMMPEIVSGGYITTQRIDRVPDAPGAEGREGTLPFE